MRRNALMCLSAVGLVLVVAACGDSDGDGSLSEVSSESSPSEQSSDDELATGPPVATGGVASGPAPLEMCDAGEVPIVAAYAIETGEYRWSRCSPEQVWRSIVAATDDAVVEEALRILM